MSTAELRQGSVTRGAISAALWSAQTGQGYSDIGTAMLVLVIWPLYLRLSFHMMGAIPVIARVHILNFCIGCMCYSLCIWTRVNSDPDMANLIMRGGFLALMCSLICG